MHELPGDGAIASDLHGATALGLHHENVAVGESLRASLGARAQRVQRCAAVLPYDLLAGGIDLDDAGVAAPAAVVA